MSTLQRRWLCSECHREWIEPSAYYQNSSPLTITGNPINGVNCPICGSPEIELIEFRPALPGLDIPRDGNVKVIPINIHETIGRYTIKSEGNPNLLGPEARAPVSDSIGIPESDISEGIPDRLIEEIVNEYKRDEYNPVYDLSDMD